MDEDTNRMLMGDDDPPVWFMWITVHSLAGLMIVAAIITAPAWVPLCALGLAANGIVSLCKHFLRK